MNTSRTFKQTSKTKYLIFLVNLAMFPFSVLIAQYQVNWEKRFDAPIDHNAIFITSTPGNEILAFGNTRYSPTNPIHMECYVAKYDRNGNLLLEVFPGGNADDWANGGFENANGNIIMYGSTQSTTNGPILGLSDSWLVEIDTAGNILWSNNYGGLHTENAIDAVQTQDGGYLLGLESYSDNVYINGYGYWEYVVVKTDSVGNQEWLHTFGGSATEMPEKVFELSDGNFLVIGYSLSSDGDVSSNNGSIDVWAAKFNSAGAIIWENNFGGSGDDWVEDVCLNDDDSFVFCGFTESNDGDISKAYGLEDCWLVKVSSAGNIVWERTFGGQRDDAFYEIEQFKQGFLLSGTTNSVDTMVTEQIGRHDSWVVETDLNGNLVSQKSFGKENRLIWKTSLAVIDTSFTVLNYSQDSGSYLNKSWVFQAEGNSKECLEAPFNLHTSAHSMYAARLHWEPIDHTFRYLIRGKALHQNNWIHIAHDNPDQLHFDVSNLNYGVQYVWQVAALCDSVGPYSGGWSQTDTFQVKCPSPYNLRPSPWLSVPGSTGFYWDLQYAIHSPPHDYMPWHIRYRLVGTPNWMNWTCSDAGGLCNTASIQQAAIYVTAGTWEMAVSTICNEQPLIQSEFSTPLIVQLSNTYPRTSGIDSTSVSNLNELNTISINPNPMSSASTVQLPEDLFAAEFQVQILDLSGNLVQSFVEKSHTFKIERGRLEAGIYFLKIGEKGHNLSGKFLVD